jgi:hypothetical protein
MDIINNLSNKYSFIRKQNIEQQENTDDLNSENKSELEDLSRKSVKPDLNTAKVNIIEIPKSTIIREEIKPEDLTKEELRRFKISQSKRLSQSLKCEYRYRTKISLPNVLKLILDESKSTFSYLIKPAVDELLTSETSDKLQKLARLYEKSKDDFGGKKFCNRVDLTIYSNNIDYNTALKNISNKTRMSITEICIALFYEVVKTSGMTKKV